MATKEVVAPETFEIEIDFSDWDCAVEHEDVDVDVDEDKDKQQLCSEWKRPIVVADTKKSSNMSPAERYFREEFLKILDVLKRMQKEKQFLVIVCIVSIMPA